ncbi:MAG TPA: adenylate/guanylate cyclase domain-containing response regulator, partial [Turneriella sp.]|nr:adenylate/guanylate cyclase domain-containing response regulator [Turneriella sp.]
YFTTGQSALAALESNTYDLAFLDIYLPDISGLAVLDAMRLSKKHSGIPILAMTADVTEEMSVTALMKEADEVLLKPLRHTEIVIKAKLWLERQAKRIKLHETNIRLQAQSKIMASYFPDDVIQKLTDTGAMMVAGVIPTTVMFFDLHNFTALSEKIEPAQVAELLNSIFTDLMDLIFAHHGSVNKFIGDAIMATFGAPLSQGNDALNAVRCAFTIKESMALFNQVRPPYLTQELNFGIGIATGSVFAGTVGSSRRLEYTILGDTVDVASRLESLNKISKTKILIDGATYEKTKHYLNVRRLCFQKKIRGKSHEFEVFSPHEILNEPSP